MSDSNRSVERVTTATIAAAGKAAATGGTPSNPVSFIKPDRNWRGATLPQVSVIQKQSAWMHEMRPPHSVQRERERERASSCSARASCGGAAVPRWPEISPKTSRAAQQTIHNSQIISGGMSCMSIAHSSDTTASALIPAQWTGRSSGSPGAQEDSACR